MNPDDDAVSQDILRAHYDLKQIMRRHGVARTLLMMAMASEGIATEQERDYGDSHAAEEWRQCADEMHAVVRRWREGAGF